MNVETRIILDKFKARPYQKPLFDAIEKQGIKRAVLVWHRRAGKDVACFNLLVRQALKVIGSYYYILPTYRQARLVLFEGMTMEGKKFIDYIPEALIRKINVQEMKVTLINGSQIYFLGSDNYDSLRGSNPKGIVFSEYAYQHPATYPTLRPILVANDGWCVFISTPFGENHFYKLYEVAKESDEWFCDVKTVEDTDVVSPESIEREEREGLMSRDMIEQEYYCSFSVGAMGSYYARYLNSMEMNNQIGDVPWEPAFPVYTAWDLGVRDATVILFFQIIGKVVHIIDSYANDSHGLEHYVSEVLSKNYTYAKHFAPHDIMVKEFGSGMSRLDKAKELGLKFEVKTDHRNVRSSAVPSMSIMDGIETVRSTLPKIWIDKEKCRTLVSAIRDYRKEYDSKNKVYKASPLHDNNSHWCFTLDTLILTRTGMRRIIDVTDKDEVLTLHGWKRCTKAYKTRTNAKLVEVTFQDGTKVKCTPDHLFLTENGWRSAKDLRRDTVIQSSLMKQHNYSMKNDIRLLRHQNIIEDGRSIFIDRYGLKHLGQYLRDAIFTIKIATQRITTYGIWNACLLSNIRKYLNQIIKAFLTKQEKLQVIGISPMLDVNGIKSRQEKLEIGKSGNGKIFHANFVEKYSLQSSGKDQHVESTVMPTVKQLRVESVSEMKETQDVYDIGVPEAGHFSLSNGAIVHNCDALRYLCLSLPRCRKSTSSEDIDRHYREAMMGDDAHMPAMFRDTDHRY